ncbi:MAG: glycosyltransferase [Terrimicrobiaceae bacterium]
MPAVSLVIPCRNEQARLPSTLDAVKGFLDRADFPGEVVVVVEKGTDQTVEIATSYTREDPRFHVIANPVARGKGFAVKTGMLAATGDVIFFMDADLSVPLRFVPDFLAGFAQGADVVFGSRQHPDSVIVRSQPLRRVLAGRAFNLCLRLCGATKFHDTQCGFKAFRKAAAKAIFENLSVDGFGFDVEALALADHLGFRIVERPVEWCDAPGSKVRALRDGSRAFLEAVAGAKRAKKISPQRT